MSDNLKNLPGRMIFYNFFCSSIDVSRICYFKLLIFIDCDLLAFLELRLLQLEFGIDFRNGLWALAFSHQLRYEEVSLLTHHDSELLYPLREAGIVWDKAATD